MKSRTHAFRLTGPPPIRDCTILAQLPLLPPPPSYRCSLTLQCSTILHEQEGIDTSKEYKTQKKKFEKVRKSNKI